MENTDQTSESTHSLAESWATMVEENKSDNDLENVPDRLLNQEEIDSLLGLTDSTSRSPPRIKVTSGF